jgi:1-acyl-sn-glycerol-3-phosphate acyltransferase
MSDPPDSPATVELFVEEPRAGLPIDPDELREQLPGLEPDRDVSDWGRSERVERAVDRTICHFLYRYWFRVGVEAIENVPDQGGALLIANRAGTLPTDVAMIAKALREEHPRGRALHVASDPSLTALPAVGMIATKLGAVGCHPANLHRLLFDERALVLAYPEGRVGARKPLRDRYRLRRFDAAPFAATAIRARVPIVPVVVLGAEEALPGVRFPRALGALRIPLSAGLPLPAKFRIRFLEPVATDALEPAAAGDRALTSELTARIRALMQENLIELVAQRRSPWLG